MACVPQAPATSAETLARVRAAGATGAADAAAEWLSAELLEPGGTAQGAEQARRRLSTFAERGLTASMVRALDADAHGRLADAGQAYLDVLVAACGSNRSEAPLFGWYAAARAEAIRPTIAGFWQRAAPLVRAAISAPGNLGWRARSVLVEWQARETSHGGVASKELSEQLVRDQGCIESAAFAGPFGQRQPGDHRVHFQAEAAPPWPVRFVEDPASVRAESRPAEHRGCMLFSKSSQGEGIHYVQTFVELDLPRDVLLAVSGAFSVMVDDREVLVRDEAEWGSWPRLGVALRLTAGRHRILARIGRPETSVRVLALDGRPLPFTASAHDDAPYVLTPPQVLADPNPLEPHLRALGVRGLAPSIDVDTTSRLARFVAASLAAGEGHRDVADVLLAPLVEPSESAALALAQAARFVEGDPIFSREIARSMAREFHARAVERDPALWTSALWLLLDRAAQARPAETASEIEELVARFPEVPTIAAELASIEEQLGWTALHARTVAALAERFPDDVPTLEALLATAERQGDVAAVARLTQRIGELDPANEVEFRRALRRGDFDAAVAELRRIEGLRSDRGELALRIADLLARAGKGSASASTDRAALRKLELALERQPTNAAARLALADARHAMGDRHALEEALVDAIRSGSDTSALHQAIELVDGVTALEPYRKDGLAILREAEEKGIALPGTASRILDYSALWIAADGSARMLEHTILRVQSREGIARHVEQRLPQGSVLTLRTIKKDGRIFEPEIVQGKPTVTMPHLEVGDCIETESLWVMEGDGEGRRFRSPRWFFREPNVSYHLSQFVVISPKSRPLVIETTGDVPAPVLVRSEGLEVRRWTVTAALAVPEEPATPPIEEFLPSVLVGWGADWLSQLERLSQARGGGRPADPRLLRIARTIAAGKLDGSLEGVSKDARARRIYRWVVDNITPGEERWPARIVTSKSGDLTEAFLFLCGLVGVDARLGVVKSRLAPPPRGTLSDLEAFSSTAVRVVTEGGPRWMLVGARYAPYGFLPSFLAGQPGILVDAATNRTRPESAPLERERTTTGGVDDGVVHRGKVTLAADGSAKLHLSQEFRGRYAIAVRTALSQVEAVGRAVDRKREELVEQRMLGPKLPGAHLEKMTIVNLDALDQPLTIELEVAVPLFARKNDRGLEFSVPFLGSMSPLVGLPRRESPLYIEESAQTLVVLDVALPPGTRLATMLEAGTVDEPGIRVRVADRLEPGLLHLEREANLPAGRIPPDDYAPFRESLLRADRLLNQPIRVER